MVAPVTTATLPVWIPGEPVLSGGRGQETWQEAIRERVPTTVRHPSLTFVVSALRRRGHPFDLDNLVHPVLMVFDDPVDSVSARMYVGDAPGVLIDEVAPAPPPEECLKTIYVEDHSSESVQGRSGIPEIAHDPMFDEHEGIGLLLAFDRPDIPIRKGWFGPTEAVIDDLVPWLGRYTTRGLIADHRMRDLRIVRGVNQDRRGVKISIWYVPDDEIPVPPTLRRSIDGLDASFQRHTEEGADCG